MSLLLPPVTRIRVFSHQNMVKNARPLHSHPSQYSGSPARARLDAWVPRTQKDKPGSNTLYQGQPGCSVDRPVAIKLRHKDIEDPLFPGCKQGANSTEPEQHGFKNVSCESASRQLWEPFLRWEEAVIASPR